MKYVATAVMCTALLVFAHTASAQVGLYATDFENPPFTTGNLVGQDGWVTHSGTGSPVQVIAGQAIELVQGSGSREDVSIDLGATMIPGAIFEFSFDVVVAGSGDATTSYFAHFKDSGTGFNSRIFVTVPNTAGNEFTFAIGETSSSAPAAAFATDFNYGQVYTLSGEYNFDTGISTLSVDGGAPIDSSTQADPGEDISTFAFRQSGGNTSMVIDDLDLNGNPVPVELMTFTIE